MIHAGTNSIRHGISATEIMTDTTDLADCMRKQVTKTKIIFSGVLYWRNISDCFVSINTELDWLCSARDCLMVDSKLLDWEI